jgi:hypothetical protein
MSIVNIPSDELNGVNGVVVQDAASLAASSVSGDDFASSPKKDPYLKRTSASSNRFSSEYTRSGGPHDHPDTALPNQIEKLVEERVQAEVATMWKSVEAEIRRIESRMELDYKARIEELEKKTDKVNSILSKILSRKGIAEDRLEI